MALLSSREVGLLAGTVLLLAGCEPRGGHSGAPAQRVGERDGGDEVQTHDDGGPEDDDAAVADGDAAAPELCAIVALLGSQDRAGVRVSIAEGSVSALTDADGRFCFAGLDSYEGSMDLEKGEYLEHAPEVRLTSAVIEEGYDRRVIGERLTSETEHVFVPLTLEIARFPRVKDGRVLVKFHEGDRFFFFENERGTPLVQRGAQATPFYGDLVAVDFSGERDPVAASVFTQDVYLPDYFEVDTTAGPTLFYRSDKGTSLRMEPPRAWVPTGPGSWSGVCPDGKHAVFTVADGIQSTDLSQVGTTKLAIGYLRPRGYNLDDGPPLCGPDGYLYFWQQDTTARPGVSTGSLSRVQVTGGTPEIVVSKPTLSAEAALSPDGKKLMWQEVVDIDATNRTVTLMLGNSDGSAGVQLAQVSGFETQWRPSFSADSQFALFHRDGGLHRVAVDGSSHIVEGDYLRETLSPDGSRRLYYDQDALHLAKVDGSSDIQLGSDVLTGARFLPDGSGVVFATRGAAPRDGAVHFVTLAGVETAVYAHASDPVFSPGGSRFLFATWDENGSAIAQLGPSGERKLYVRGSPAYTTWLDEDRIVAGSAGRAIFQDGMYAIDLRR